MKATTIHINALGEVTNPISANGFRLEDDHGAWVEARVVDGSLRFEFHGREQKIDSRTLEPVRWLAPDGRCESCTRLTPDEVTGHEG